MASKQVKDYNEMILTVALKGCLRALRSSDFRKLDAEVYWQINDALLRGLEVLRQQEDRKWSIDRSALMEE
jgi:hypothetical protein